MMEKSTGKGFSVGLGLTNECNLACAHCYRDTGRIDRLSLEDIRRACEAVPVRSVNLGTGENGLHPEFHAILQYLRERGTTIALTSNGYTAAVLRDDELCCFADLEFSLDFATEREQDSWRGPGNWRLVLDQTGRALRLGVPVTIIAVMMRTNYDKLPEIGALAARQGANFRVNVYQAVKTDAFSLNYEQFWTGFQRLLESCPLAVCNEPIVRAILGFDAVSGGCGKGTIRITPKGDVLPCVYWPKRNLDLAELEKWGAAIVDSPAFRELDRIPQFCGNCSFVESCRGGCPSRRLLRGGLDLPDEFCPFAAGKSPLSFASRAGSLRQFPKAGSACTTVFGAKEQGEAKG
ncbi:MAG: radical SAM protein [Deltaproteobacteria bacterium]|nr:radical SAM protein [Deltaproteobacteria bacterium]